MKKLRIALIGQGRSGRDIHGAYLKSEKNNIFDVAYVVDEDELRRNRALEEYPGCKVFADYKELFNCDDIDVVLNSTYSNFHYPITKDLLEHKFNVLVEKPFVRTYYEAKELMKIAQDNGVVLAVFQQTFLAPFYIEAKKVIESGKLGDIKQVNIRYCGFSRRWDWQTLQCRMAGSLFNTGPHPVGLALGFLDFSDDMKVAFSNLDLALTSGDAEDCVKVIFTAPSKPIVDVEINSNDAFPDGYTLKIMGTKGTFACNGSDYKMKYIVDGENVERKPEYYFIKDDKDMPAYCSEELKTHEETGKFEGTAFDVGTRKLYESLYNTITTNAELAVPTEVAAKVVNAIERIHAENPLPMKFKGE